MTSLKRWMIALTVMSASALVHAADDNFTSLTFGQPGNKVKKALGLNGHFNLSQASEATHDNGWTQHLGQPNPALGYRVAYQNVSGSCNGIKLPQDTLHGGYDLSYPVGGSAQLFGAVKSS